MAPKRSFEALSAPYPDAKPIFKDFELERIDISGMADCEIEHSEIRLGASGKTGRRRRRGRVRTRTERHRERFAKDRINSRLISGADLECMRRARRQMPHYERSWHDP